MKIIPALASFFLVLGVQAAVAAPATLEEAFDEGFQLISSNPVGESGSAVFYLRKRAHVIVCGVALDFAGGEFPAREETLKSTCKDLK